MHFTLHYCAQPHPATYCANKHPISRGLYEATLIAMMNDWHTPHAICAYHKGKIIGVFKFRMLGRNKTYLRAAGTAVSKKYRGKRIAERLWDYAIKKFSPTTIDVITATKEGKALVAKMKKKHSGKKIRWVVANDC